MKNLGRAIMEAGLVLVAVLALSTMSQAATGDLVGNVTFSQNCTSGLGTGVTFDGANLWYSCYSSPTDLYRADPTTGTVSASYTIEGGLGSIAYDATRNVIWAANGGGSSIPGEVYMIQLDAGKNVISTTPKFNTGVSAGLIDGIGFDSTVTPNQIYWSPDGSTTIYVFDVNGNPVRSFHWTGTSCYNSGVAMGGNLLFQGSDGCSHVWVVDKNTLAPAFNFSTQVAGDPNFRDEGLSCDPNTFAPVDVMWSKEAYTPARAHAFEIPKGTCGFGGQQAAPKGNISGIKFNDLNGNGTQDAGEPGLANWTITLTNDTGVTITQTTAPDGSYNFTNLTDGNYTVGEVLQPGWIQTAPAVSMTGSATYTVNISGGNGVVGKDFGNFQLGSVSGTKFEDLNANGVRDPNESGLAGWNITINGTDSITGTAVSQTTTTDANGNYNFTGLTAGTYTISETMQNGWVQTAPTTGTYTVTITSGAAITGQDFGNFHKGKITGGGWINITGDPKATFGIVGQYPDSSNTAQGNVEYQDHIAKLNIKSIQINTVATTLDKKKGVITGLAQVNGAGSYPFVVYVEDNAEPGKGTDVFKISLPTYPYSNGAILSSGNIQIHS
ncbi:SdrD B-like domain protein [uncultured archaeon]|nr:SdrD B-like domain protein [uncultured archaeon]